MATDRLAEIANRVQAATEGTWGTYYDGSVYHLGTNLRLPEELSGRQIGKIPDGDDRTQAFHDAMFIGRAPGDVRFLLEEVARIQTDLNEATAKLEIAERRNRDLADQLDERTQQLNGLLDSLTFDERAVPQ